MNTLAGLGFGLGAPGCTVVSLGGGGRGGERHLTRHPLHPGEQGTLTVETKARGRRAEAPGHQRLALLGPCRVSGARQGSCSLGPGPAPVASGCPGESPQRPQQNSPGMGDRGARGQRPLGDIKLPSEGALPPSTGQGGSLLEGGAEGEGMRAQAGWGLRAS